jgi:hypothetical protein
VLSPTSGITWEAGKTYNISWMAANAPSGAWVGVVRLYGAQFLIDIVPSFSWNPPTATVQYTVPNNSVTGNDFKIHVVLNQGPVGSESNIAEAWSAPFSIVAATSSATPSFSSFAVSPASVTSGGTVTFSFSGTNISYYNFYLFCPVNVSAYAQGINICNTTQKISGGYNEYSVQFTNTGTNAMLVAATLYAYDANGAWVDQKTVSINVIQAGGVGQSASLTQLANTLESMKALLEELSRLVR